MTAEKLYPAPVVTRVEPASMFYIAENYHQEYFARNPYQGYCQFVVAPKLAKFREHFFERLKKQQA
jgi:peptide-methionine (S)-S-oxide reductase